MSIRIRVIGPDLKKLGPVITCDHTNEIITDGSTASFGWRTGNPNHEASAVFHVKNEHRGAFEASSGGQWLWTDLAALPIWLVYNIGLSVDRASEITASVIGRNGE